MKWLAALSLVGLATPMVADVLDLGDLAQYDGRNDGPPALSGTTVWISGKEGDGFDIALSPDAEAKVRGVLEACVVPDQKCYEDVNNVLVSADLEYDAQLERRGIIALLSKTAKKSGWVFFMMWRILDLRWRLKHNDEGKKLFIPEAKASEAGNAITSTEIVVSASGTAITVTPAPEPTIAHAGQPPVVTPVTEAGNGLAVGDFVIIMDPELASKIQDVMSQATDCVEGRQFDLDDGTRKRDLSALGQGICGMIATAVRATNGGTFDILTLLDAHRVDFAWATRSLIHAAQVLSDFIRDYAPQLSIPPESRDIVVEEMVNILLGLGVTWLVDKIPLGQENRIAASLVTKPTPTATATSTSSGCPDPTATPLFCGYEEGSDCEANMPRSADKEIVCATGKYKDCKCNTPYLEFTEDFTVQEQQFLDLALELSKPLQPSPKCTGLQSNTYVTRNVVHDLIVNSYCNLWQGDVTQIGMGAYMHDTPEAVEIGAIGDTQTEGGITPQECEKWLHVVLDNCDTDATANPMNWKAGGEIEVNHWTYSIKALHDRPPAPKNPSAWCKLFDCGDAGCKARIWGAGWLTSTPAHGEDLFRAISTTAEILNSPGVNQQLGDHHGISTERFHETWGYELKDGHEWGVEIDVDTGPFIDAAKLLPNITRILANKDDLSYLKVDDCAT